MQIGIVAKRIGLSLDAIRFYERNALLPRPPGHQEASGGTVKATLRHSPSFAACRVSDSQQLLARHASQNVAVLVVWEPILVTDWRQPGTNALARIPDLRARQFWDPGHMIARALSGAAKQKPPQPEPGCCIARGFYWDEAILYPPRAQWSDLPASAFWNGPVAQVIPGLEKLLNDQH